MPKVDDNQKYKQNKCVEKSRAMENVFPKSARLGNVKHFFFVKTSWESLIAVSKYY